MAEILKLSDWGFSVTRMHMLRALSSHQRTSSGGLTVIRPPPVVMETTMAVRNSTPTVLVC